MKNVNLKRLASMAMAGVMTLSLAVPALAEDSTTITGKYTEVELQVTVPGDTNAIINPYGLPTPTMEDGETVISGEPITTGAPLIISNQSKVDLAVGVKGTITPTTGVKIVANEAAVTVSTPATTAQPKNIWVDFEMFAAPDITVDNETDPSVTNPAYAALNKATPDVTFTFATNTDDSAKTVEATDTLVLRAGKDETTQKGGAAYIRLHGAVAKKPTKTAGSALEDDPWVAADGFTAKIVYSFEPSEYATEVDVNLAADTIGEGTGSTAQTTTLSIDVPTGKTVAKEDVEISFSGSGTAPEASAVNVASGKITATITGTGAGAGAWTVNVRFVDSEGNVYKGTADLTVTAT